MPVPSTVGVRAAAAEHERDDAHAAHHAAERERDEARVAHGATERDNARAAHGAAEEACDDTARARTRPRGQSVSCRSSAR